MNRTLLPSVLPDGIAGKRVCVTGAAGSIGSALAMEISRHRPERLVLLDASEQGLFRLEREEFPACTSVLGSVCDAGLMRAVAEEHGFDLVFHAAAFKHLPLLERQFFAALANNAVGTATLVGAMAAAGVPRLVLLSTDKAVEPTSILGASKRIAELIALDAGCSVVRLGNVPGSAGSVLPVFERQIEQGEDVTVTHPDATRYFVPMDDAVRLLLLAAGEAMAAGLFVPGLGAPVSIASLAEQLRAASPGSASKIVYTGLRPGEKLHEKLVASEESVIDSADWPLRRVRSPRPAATELAVALRALETAIRDRNFALALDAVRSLVPVYQPSELVRKSAEAAALTEERA